MFWGSLCMYSGICMLARVRVFTYVVHVCLLKYVNFPTFQCDSVCIHWLRQLFLRMFMVDVLMAQLWYMRVCIYKEVWRVCADWHTYVNVRHSIIQHLCGFTITIYCLRLAVFVQGRPVDAVQSALCGSFAGALAGGVTTPLDVIKTRLMLGTCKEIYTCSNTSNREENNIRIRACIHPCLDMRVYSAWHTDPTGETVINTLKRGQRNIKRKHNAHPYLYDLHYTHTYRMHVEWFTVNLLRLHMCKSTPAAIHEHISSAAQTKHHTHISPFIQVCRHKCAWPHMQNSNITIMCACVSIHPGKDSLGVPYTDMRSTFHRVKAEGGWRLLFAGLSSCVCIPRMLVHLCDILCNNSWCFFCFVFLYERWCRCQISTRPPCAHR